MNKISIFIPPTLYKYRDWSNPNHKKILIQNEIFFSPFSQFNDPYDGTIPFRYDPSQLTDKNRHLKLLQIIEREYPSWSKEKAKKYFEDNKENAFKMDDKFNEDLHKDINDTFGILSLSSERDNYLMWSHYSNSHKGFCVGLNTKLLIKQVGEEIYFEPIIYQPDLPLIELFEDYKDHFRKLLYTKSNFWNYEKEFRLVKFLHVGKTLTLTPDTISEVILGFRMEDKVKLEIINIVKKNYPTANLFEAKLNNYYFKLDIKQIN